MRLTHLTSMHLMNFLKVFQKINFHRALEINSDKCQFLGGDLLKIFSACSSQFSTFVNVFTSSTYTSVRYTKSKHFLPMSIFNEFPLKRERSLSTKNCSQTIEDGNYFFHRSIYEISRLNFITLAVMIIEGVELPKKLHKSFLGIFDRSQSSIE